MNNNEFQYTYSASQQEEIKKIRKKYLPEEECSDKLTLLKELDKSVERAGKIPALVIGVLGTLVFGLGLCFVLMWQHLFVAGVGIGSAGIVILASAYPIYKKIRSAKQEKIVPEILRLTEDFQK